MRRNTRGHKKAEEDVDLDMVPIMNMFLVLIPFLLLSASFFHLRAINTSVPVLGQSEENGGVEKKVKLTIILELHNNTINLSAVSDEIDYEILTSMERKFEKNKSKEYPMDHLVAFMKEIKNSYPASDTLILIPDESILYDTIIQTMDVARNFDDNPLFPNVVLSSKLG
jgi:biopolymer transport protein ExbD